MGLDSSRKKKSIDTPTFYTVVNGIESHALFTLDTEGFITSWNQGAENIMGWDEDEVVGRSFDILYPDVDRKAGLPGRGLKLAAAHNDFQEEALRVKKSNETFLANVSINAICKHDNLIGYVVVVSDMTQRKKNEVEQIDANTMLRSEIDRRKDIEKALKDSNDELNAFASAAGHDLQEPLRMVVSYLQLIEKRYGKQLDSDGHDFLDFAIDGATRMKMLISDLVEYSRIDKLGKPFKSTDSNAVLGEVLASLEVSITETGAKITHDKLPTVWSDKVQLNELLQNLIANAIKFGVKGGKKPLTVHVGLEENSTEFIFSVADNGPGIDEKDFSNIFLIFKQLGNKLQTEGNGVGLAICKKIVKRHGGQIWVESKLGEGSVFKFSIPRYKENS